MEVRDFMTSLVVTTEIDTPVSEAAKLMALDDVGSLVITKSDVLAGLVTRREIIGAHLFSEEIFTSLVVGDIMTTPVVTVGPDADLGQVIGLMNKTGKRRIPVIEGNDIIGMVSASDIIGVLATMKLIADGISDDDDSD
ncbi:MAG: CBS domain-containing protein [Candidatus Thorarchaeota archaeon]|nr:MAG: CBS domain-containing protein [Candidatus Thorarchaeota archaeon]